MIPTTPRPASRPTASSATARAMAAGTGSVSITRAFQLVGTHATLDCAECHSSGVYQGLPAECVDCHSDNYQDAANPNHNAAGFDTECETCHRGSDPSWQDGQYPHSIYPLVATHQAQPCNACHSNNVFQGLPSDCVDCHLADYQDTDDPDHAASGFPIDCVLCHSVTSPTWDGATFDHQTFQLAGAHTTLDCADCHSSGVYQGLPSDCVDCHLTDYQDTDDPDHAASGFPTDCVLCHSGTSPTWDGATFDHTTFQLAGAHTTLDCADCHSSGVYQGLPSDCVDCHLADYQDTDDPDHAASGFPTDCVLCHAGASPTWEGATFDHTTFQLVGAHTTLDCADCHSSGVYQGLPSDCVDCHLADYQDTDDPDHVAAGFATDCVLCHSGTSPTWEGASFDHTDLPARRRPHHPRLRRLPLERCLPGAAFGVRRLPPRRLPGHRRPRPRRLRLPHRLRPLPLGHQPDLGRRHLRPPSPARPGKAPPSITRPSNSSAPTPPSTAPNATRAGSIRVCPPNAWTATATTTSRPTTPITTPPVSTPSARPATRGATRRGTTANTRTASTRWWPPTRLNPATPATRAMSFRVCRRSVSTATSPTTSRPTTPTTSPPGSPPTASSAIRPPARRGRGPVSITRASSCRAPTPPSTAPSATRAGSTKGCRRIASTATSATTSRPNDPDHVDAGFPTDCELCHSATSSTWTGASFDHTTFQLLGAHATADCAQCHSSGVYQGLPSDCVDCHLSEYQQANDPDHIAAGFPTTCDLCHRASDLSWDQGTFDHLWFPINSGDHRNIECSECHRSGSNFAVFTCTTSCHPRSEMDGEHDDVQGYAYNSAQCYSCHPNGEADFGRPRLMRSHESR